jgi:hypothetical protein
MSSFLFVSAPVLKFFQHNGRIMWNVRKQRNENIVCDSATYTVHMEKKYNVQKGEAINNIEFDRSETWLIFNGL